MNLTRKQLFEIVKKWRAQQSSVEDNSYGLIDSYVPGPDIEALWEAMCKSWMEYDSVLASEGYINRSKPPLEDATSQAEAEATIEAWQGAEECANCPCGYNALPPATAATDADSLCHAILDLAACCDRPDPSTTEDGQPYCQACDTDLVSRQAVISIVSKYTRGGADQ